jgi:hypothetical protein
MSKTTTKVTYVTKFVLSKPFVIKAFPVSESIVYNKGRVLQTIRHRSNHYFPTDHVITLGQGWTEVIPADSIAAKWYKETTITVVNTEEVDGK